MLIHIKSQKAGKQAGYGGRFGSRLRSAVRAAHSHSFCWNSQSVCISKTSSAGHRARGSVVEQLSLNRLSPLPTVDRDLRRILGDHTRFLFCFCSRDCPQSSSSMHSLLADWNKGEEVLVSEQSFTS